MARRWWTREEQRRYKKQHAEVKRVTGRLLGYYVYKCYFCHKDFQSKRDSLSMPCCDECIPF